MELSPKKVLQKDERGREGKWDFCGRLNGERITDRGVSLERIYHKSKGWISIETEFKDESGRAEPLATFCERKQRLTAKLYSRSYVQNNRGSQKQVMKEMILQQQKNEHCVLNVVEKLLNKWSAIKVFLFKTCCCWHIRFNLNVYMYFRTFKHCTLDEIGCSMFTNIQIDCWKYSSRSRVGGSRSKNSDVWLPYLPY